MSDKPLIPTKSVGPAKALDEAESIMNRSIAMVNEASRRGYFTLHDLEGIIAANLAMALQAGHRKNVGQRIRLVADQVKTLREIIKSREDLALQREMAERLTGIEDKLSTQNNPGRNRKD